MTCRTLRCRQVSTWLGSGWSGISVTTVGTLPLGLRPGLPLGLLPGSMLMPAPSGASDASPSALRPICSPPVLVVESCADVSACGARHQTSVRRTGKMSYLRDRRVSYSRSIEHMFEWQLDRRLESNCCTRDSSLDEGRPRMSATTVEGPGRRAGAVPGRRVVAPVPRQRLVAAAPGRRPVLSVVPPLRAAGDERPALQLPVPGAAAEQRVRRAAPATPAPRAKAS